MLFNTPANGPTAITAFLIDEFIPENAVVVVWGDLQDCKSFMLIDQMLCMSHGVLWHGRKAKKSRSPTS